MRTPIVFAALALCGLTAVAPAQDSTAKLDYKIVVDQKSLFSRMVEKRRMVSFQFEIRGAGTGEVVTGVPKEEIVIEEDSRRVQGLEIFPPAAQNLTPILAIDISGSMATNYKIEQARQAALAFLDRLDAKADVGLILFDHEIKVAEPPARDPAKIGEHRKKIRGIIEDKDVMKPQGGTAYLDATIRAVGMLKGIKGRKAVVVMTDGVDMNSKAKLDEAIEAAMIGELPVYTIGIGEKGKDEKVTTVMVLDRSGSMLAKADEGDDKKKIDALKEAATRFAELMRPGAKTIVQSFSSRVDRLDGDFTDDKAELKRQINALKADGDTALYAATYSALMTLEAKGVSGKRAVVVLTDGVDEGNEAQRRSEREVIALAKDSKIPLYMLGLGRKNEINEEVMQKMAKDTGGEYYHAGSQKKLLEVFENLSIQLHDDGIDEASLRKLAEKTGGKYTHISDAKNLTIFYERLADELQKTYKVTFESRRSSQDGTARGIDVKIVRDGKVVSEAVEGVTDVARGLAVPQMSYGVYLVFLAALGMLLALPAMGRKLFKGTP